MIYGRNDVLKLVVVILSFAFSTFAYNWEWDQGHDVVVIAGAPYSGIKGYVDGGTLDFVPCDCCEEGDRMCNVYALSGIGFDKVSDMSLPGPGPNLDLHRAWNSNDPVSGIFGHGWTFNFGRTILPVKGNDEREYIVVRRSNGQEVKLLRSGNTFSGIDGKTPGFTVDVTATGWKLTEKHGSVTLFNADGKPVSITDRNALALNITYNSTSGCINRITNAAGNFIDFTFNPNGKIDAATDNLGRTVQYSYTGDNLTQVTYWDGSQINYTYGTLDLLQSISNRRGQAIRTFVYDDMRRVIQFTERGETFTLQYNDNSLIRTKTDSHGRTWTAYLDESGAIKQMIDPLGHSTNKQVGADGNLEWKEDANGNRTTFTHDANGNMLSRTDPLNNTEHWTYNAQNLVTEYTDAGGVATRYLYDQKGNLTQKTEAAGTAIARVWGSTYDEDGNMLTETNPAGAVTTWEYDEQGNNIRKIGPIGDTTAWEYDDFGRMTSMTNPLGNTWTYTYDEMGNLLTQTDPLNNVVSKEYDVDGNLTAEVDALSNRTTYKYDAWDRLQMKIGPIDDTTTYQYIAIGDDDFVSGIRDAEGHWTYFQYDNKGRKTTQIVKMNDDNVTADNDDLVTSFTYDDAGNLLKVTNPEGDTTGSEFDANNRRIKQCNGEGECMQTSYDIDGRVATMIQPNGNVISYSYNALGQVIRISDSIGIVNEKQYDNSGNVIWDRTPGRGAMMYQYDMAGRIIHQMDSCGVGSRLTYNKAGQVLTLTDSLHNTTDKGYDVLGRVIWTRNALGDTVKNLYDANGNQTALIDPDGNTTNLMFDASGRTVATVYPDNSVDSSYYAKMGSLKRKKDPNGIYTDFAYDDARHLIRKSYSDGKTPEDSYTYDKDGRMLTANNSVAQLTWQYDNASRPTRYQQVVDNENDVLLYSYDIANGTSSLTYPDGKVVQRKLDLRNRLDSVVVDGNLVVADYNYSGMAISSKTLGNGIVANYSYNNAGRLTQLAYIGGPGTLPDFSYGYDMAGNIHYLLRNHQENMSETYEYDAISQLVRWRRGELTLSDTTVHSPNYYQEWDLDKRGNWSRFNNNGSVETRTHNTVNEIVDIDREKLFYDENGNILNDRQLNFTWDARNHTLSAGEETFLYDALGRRVGAELKNGSRKYYVFNYWQEVVEIKNNLRKNNLYGAYIDELLLQSLENKYIYMLQNHLFSIVLLTNDLGNELESYEYLPFGNTVIYDNAKNKINESVYGNENQFVGRIHHGEVNNIINFRNRFYDSNTGRFISRDPMKYFDGNNMYIYVHNNPINNLDPLGLWGGPDHRALGGKVDGVDYSALDNSWSTSPFNPNSMYLHFLPLSVVESFLEIIIQIQDKNKFQEWMHSGQDYFSHYKRGYRGGYDGFTIGHGMGSLLAWLKIGGNPDDKNTAEYAEAEIFTEKWENKFIEGSKICLVKDKKEELQKRLTQKESFLRNSVQNNMNNACGNNCWTFWQYRW